VVHSAYIIVFSLLFWRTSHPLLLGLVAQVLVRAGRPNHGACAFYWSRILLLTWCPL